MPRGDEKIIPISSFIEDYLPGGAVRGAVDGRGLVLIEIVCSP
jgi:hypothetical protein